MLRGPEWIESLETNSEEATLVVRRKIKPGREREYEDWLERITQRARGFPGFKGATTLFPREGDSNISYVISRFASQRTLENWKNSQERLKLIDEVEDYASQHFAETTAMETWFALPGGGGLRCPSQMEDGSRNNFWRLYHQLPRASRVQSLLRFMAIVRKHLPLYRHPRHPAYLPCDAFPKPVTKALALSVSHFI